MVDDDDENDACDSKYTSNTAKASLSKRTQLCCCFAACLTTSTRQSLGMNATDMIQTTGHLSGLASKLGHRNNSTQPPNAPMKHASHDRNAANNAPTPALVCDSGRYFGAAERPLPHQHGHEKSKVIQRANKGDDEESLCLCRLLPASNVTLSTTT